MKQVIFFIAFVFQLTILGMQVDKDAVEKMCSDIAKIIAKSWSEHGNDNNLEDRHYNALKKCPITIINGIYYIEYGQTLWSYYPPPKKIPQLLENIKKT